MGLNGRTGNGGGEGGLWAHEERELAVRTQTETASNGSLMRDGQCGLYLITNQHSFEFSGERKCKL
ncbi:hypothetical protein EXN66_Car011771 [Channa argus]|uniref:Uncharacterized protein n=1 Tax=Channa argus TaxID=215402 RepID=A0A6G1Q0P7_CHAAH|nr:hypothetical protein EXN66_Car011771 [Channa argus]